MNAKKSLLIVFLFVFLQLGVAVAVGRPTRRDGADWYLPQVSRFAQSEQRVTI